MPISQKIRNDFEAPSIVTKPFNDSNKQRATSRGNESFMIEKQITLISAMIFPSTNPVIIISSAAICLSSCQQPGIHPFSEGKTWMLLLVVGGV